MIPILLNIFIPLDELDKINDSNQLKKIKGGGTTIISTLDVWYDYVFFTLITRLKEIIKLF